LKCQSKEINRGESSGVQTGARGETAKPSKGGRRDVGRCVSPSRSRKCNAHTGYPTTRRERAEREVRTRHEKGTTPSQLPDNNPEKPEKTVKLEPERHQGLKFARCNGEQGRK